MTKGPVTKGPVARQVIAAVAEFNMPAPVPGLSLQLAAAGCLGCLGCLGANMGQQKRAKFEDL